LNQETTGNIISAIRRGFTGKAYRSDPVTEKLADRLSKSSCLSREAFEVKQLSEGEHEVFEALGRGMQAREVAYILCLSLKAVQAYCERIKINRNLANATELLQAAFDWSGRCVDGRGI
jgi:DNA-binding NarL/FixJ family response regulator